MAATFDMPGYVRVQASRRPLDGHERALLGPDLEDRGIALGMLDLLPPRGRYFQLLRAKDAAGRLLGVTSLMSVRPFVAIKQNLGEGNHVGWDTSTYVVPGVDRAMVTAALLGAIAERTGSFGMYFGRLDDDVTSALPYLRHRLLETGYELGRIDCSGFRDPGDFLAGHKRLRRHLRDHARAGGSVQVTEGPVDDETARRFSDLVLATYRHHGGIGRWQFREYAESVCGHFFRTCPDAVHIHTVNHGQVTGLQSFMRHRDRLELVEGGFFRDGPNHHAYEAIIAESVAHAVRNGLGAVGYGGIWNAGKDRYCDKEGRGRVHLLMVYANRRSHRAISDRVAQRGFRAYFGRRFEGASDETRIVSSDPGP